ncbi:MAG TPA: MFS transporter [Acidimicrobiales bacterium]|jgi:MFS family permease|nr:MFS transporter [Acidimicrobiales bacterium]
MVVDRWSRSATVAVFFAHGLLFASWTAHIPQIKAQLGLTNGDLGLALLGAPLGSVSAMLVSARLLPHFGSKTMVRVCLLGYCAAGPFVGLVGSLPALFIALFVWGAFQGALDVSMNTQAVAVERARERPLMSGFHASWSIGTLSGAGIGALGVAIGLSLTTQQVLLGVPALVIAGWLTTRMLPDAVSRREAHNRSRRVRRLSAPVLVLGAIAFASMLCEGASADWASVYLRGAPLHTGAAVAGLGYAAFSLTMVIVRLSGNRLLVRFQPRSVLPVLAAIATVGFTAGLLGDRTVSVIVGFACLGVGLGLIVPTVFSAAGRLSGINPGMAIATVSTCGWLGFVCGPPLIGQLASLSSLSLALGVVPVLTAGIVLATALTPALRDDGPGPRR